MSYIVQYNLPEGIQKGDEYYCRCPNPLCTNPKKFQFNLTKRVGHCWSCDFKISNETEAKRVFGSGLSVLAAYPYQQLSSSVPEAIVPVLLSVSESPREYLRQRGVIESYWQNIFYSPDSDMLYFPIDSVDNRHKPSWQRRRVGQKGWMTLPGVDKEFYLFNWSMQRLKHTWWYVLVEGPFDVLVPKVSWWKDHAVALLGSTLYEPQLHTLVQEAPLCVVVWLDPDKAGREGAADAIAKLSKWWIPTVNFIHKHEPADCTDLAVFQTIEQIRRDAR